MSEPKEFSREWFIEQARKSAENVEQLRKAFPGCFDEQGRAIVASAHLPLPTQTPGGGKP